jgi:hypothetical protein
MGIIGPVASLSALALAAISGLGHRWGWWTFGTGFAVLKWAAYLAIAALVLSVVGAVLNRPGRRHRKTETGSGRGIGQGFAWTLVGVVVSAGMIAVPVYWLYRAQHAPRIHDISTDTVDPPRFEAILPQRRDAPNSAEYGGAAIAAQQQAAYPDIRSLLIARPPGEVFDFALAKVRAHDWRVVDARRAQGRIEATDTTFWFGFKDDVVIRIRAVTGGSELDMRSVSRVGLSDVGTNARRIRCFLREMREASPESIQRTPNP